ncbi:hypotheticalsprotein [Cercospora beticola]|uniref:Hypotheticalsprotein n=1 Tax=Cercospora beticola TaxID=122368 RepID=A0A2G5HKM7_CERBT|nr:hypotheticalsprotein [Cercospora beticola]PIA92762.1 hypotheticalsprotein [Cercospora beticola]WPB01491.1 hypothetical protein RHO25_006117 [Cercospora beticola]CAK1363718.1 unnamed protein product [Cercospora beticola]
MSLGISQDLLICRACGTQFDVPADQPLKSCRICDDPRQYVPPQGQTWTSLASLHSSKEYKNQFQPFPNDPRLISISTTPKFGIGQRAILICTPSGNILWDLIAYLDQETVDFINSKAGLKAIVISHPHYYTTHLDWAKTFNCPVYVSKEDEEWVCRKDGEGRRKLIENEVEEIVEGVKAIKVGGHFPGSLVLLWEGMLFIADSFLITPSGLYHVDRPAGTNSFVFMYSYPNMIPLPPPELQKMWQVLKKHDFESAHGAFTGQDVYDKNVKARVLESMKIQVRAMGWNDVPLLQEKV